MLGGGVTVNVPGAVLERQIVYAQLRSWETVAGPTYESAMAAGGKFGFSNIVPMPVVFGTQPPELPVGLQSFCLIPEPSTLALFGCAAAAFGIYAGSRSAKQRRRS